MRKKELMSIKEVNLEDDRIMRLEYSLTENKSIDNDEPYYGVEIIRYLDDDYEVDEVTGISYSREKVKSIIEILSRNTVTPISMAEIIDDLITLEAV